MRELHRSDPERARAMLEELYGYLPADSRRGPAWDRFLLETGARRRPDRLPHDPGRGDRRGEGLLPPRGRGGDRRRPVTGSPARRAFPTGSATGAASSAPPGLRSRPCWSPICSLPRATGSLWRMGWRAGIPFLDHRVFEHAVRLPPERKLDGMREKAALRDLAADLLPEEIVSRSKQPYRAPEVAPFFDPGAPDWVEESLSAAALEETGIWEPAARRGPAAPLPGRQGDRVPRGHGADRNPLHPVVASCLLSFRPRCLPAGSR